MKSSAETNIILSFALSAIFVLGCSNRSTAQVNDIRTQQSNATGNSFSPSQGTNSQAFQSTDRPTFGPVKKRQYTPASLQPQTQEKQPPVQTLPTPSFSPPAKPATFSPNRPTTNLSQPTASRRQTQEVEKSLSDYEDVPFCIVEFKDDILLPAKEVGVIKSLAVEEGEYVKAGSVVGNIDDQIYRLMLEQAELKYQIAKDTAEDNTAILAAEKKAAVAAVEARKTRKLNATGSKSNSEMLMADYTEELAKLEWLKAQNDRKKAISEAQMALAEKKVTQARLQRHVLTVDFDCYVVKLIKKPQEHVNVGDEIMQLARMDRLWVTGTVDVTALNAHEIVDRPVTVTVQLARGETRTFDGRITNVALERQTRDRYKVKAEIINEAVGNHWVLQPNMTVDMRIHLNRGSVTGGSQENSAGQFDRLKR